MQAWLKMLQAEFDEKQQVICEVIARIDVHDEEIAKRVRSDEYQALLRKAFRNWAGAESAKNVNIFEIFCPMLPGRGSRAIRF